MKLNDLVSIRVGRDHQVTFGLLVEIYLDTGTGVVMSNGRRHVRELKRIKSAEVGHKERFQKARRRRKP